MSASSCPSFWIEDPQVLFKNATDFFPFSQSAQLCTTTALNSLTRFGVYFGLVLFLCTQNRLHLLIPLGIAVVAVAIYYGMKQQNILREGFQDGKTIVTPTLVERIPGERLDFPMVGGIDVADQNISDVIGTPTRTAPTEANPFMSVLVNEVLDNPKKAPAKTTEEMGRTFSDQFQTRMYGDPSDVFQHTQNQRTWVAPPSTSIPNDGGSFQNWLYRVPGPTCKEGNTAVCRSGTEGGAVTWLNAA
jgi:hypothetical protein